MENQDEGSSIRPAAPYFAQSEEGTQEHAQGID